MSSNQSYCDLCNYSVQNMHWNRHTNSTKHQKEVFKRYPSQVSQHHRDLIEDKRKRSCEAVSRYEHLYNI